MLGWCEKGERHPGLSVQEGSALLHTGEASARVVCALVDTRNMWSSWRWSRGGPSEW